METRKSWFCQECRVEMKWNEEFHYYKCPECDVEVWVPDKSRQTKTKSQGL